MTEAGRDSRMQPLPPWLIAVDGGVDVLIHLQPGARRSGVVGVHGTRLKLAVAAPAVEGLANAALLALVTGLCGLPPRAARLVSGETSRAKRVRLAGMEPCRVAERLGGPQPGPPSRPPK
jgi:uncharacterized protein (TIGR00251 family)